MKQVVIGSLSDLEQLAAEIAGSLHGGEVLALSGELGAGKTAFVQAMAKQLGVAQPVVSPTFVLERQYQTADGKVLHHFDWYRLGDWQAVRDLGVTELFGQPDTIVAIEWPERALELLPPQTLRIQLRAIDLQRRQVLISRGDND